MPNPNRMNPLFYVQHIEIKTKLPGMRVGVRYAHEILCKISTRAGKFVIPRFRDFPTHVPRDGIDVGRNIFDSTEVAWHSPLLLCRHRPARARIMWRGCAIDERGFGTDDIDN